jgi:RNase P subunit RPR2
LVVGRGPITVTCSTCDAVSRIGVLDFLVYQLPIGYWVPRGRFGHRMTCPSCRRRVWAGVTLR